MSKTLLAVAIVAVLALPTVLVVGPADAQTTDVVPIAPSVTWSNQVSFTQRLYLRYGEVEDQFGLGARGPDCSQQQAPGTLQFFQRTMDTSAGEAARQCAFAATVGGAGAAPQNFARFTYSNDAGIPNRGLLHGFNITGNTSLIYVHKGSVPDGMQMRVDVRVLNPAGLVGFANFVGRPGTNEYVVPVTLEKTGFVFLRGQQIEVSVLGTVPTGGGVIPGSTPTWTLSETGSRLEVTSTDAMKAATWTTDEASALKTLFRPLDRNSTLIPRVVGAFAIQSAFGFADAKNLGADERPVADPNFTIVRGGAPVPLGPQGVTRLQGQLNASASQASEGRAVWNFPTGFLDYRGFPSGEYNVSVDMPYRQGGSIRAGIEAKFLIATQSVRLSAYDDNDPATFPTPLENQAHDVASGGSTTYVLLVNNTGAVNDTLAVDSGFISSTTPGWSAQLAGPGYANGVVTLAPQESKILTLTVFAPAGAALDSNAIFQVSARSLVDPTAKATPLTFISTVSNRVSRDAGLIPPTTQVSLDPGAEARALVYVWNRGTRSANLSLEVRDTSPSGWLVDIAQGENGVSRLVFPAVQPGDIAVAALRIKGPLNAPEGFHPVTLNVTHLDTGGIASDTVVQFFLKSTRGVKLQMLRAISTYEHVAEITGGPQECPTGSPDGLTCPNAVGTDGLWYRLWVSNTGTRADIFELTVDSIEAPESVVPACQDTIFAPHAPDPTRFGFFHRNINGGPSGSSTVTLNPGETGEVYLWRAVDKNQDRTSNSNCPTPVENKMDFVVTVRGRGTGSVDRQAATALTYNTGDGGGNDQPRSGAYVEAVARLPGYSAERPLVDVSQASERVVTGAVEVGRNSTFFVRVTNAASFAGAQDASVKVSLQGVDLRGGWNVSMRNVTTDLNPLTNPYTDNVTIYNFQNNRYESWFDREIEVIVAPPSGKNGTAFAGDINQFTILATAQGGRCPAGCTSALSIKAVISQFANVSLEAERDATFAHAGRDGAVMLYVNNSGSSNTTVTLRASMDPAATVRPGEWTVQPSVQTFPVAAFKNSTIAMMVRPPTTASAGTTGTVNVTIEYAPTPTPLGISSTINKTKEIAVEVAQRGTLALTGGSTTANIPPGGFANYTMNLQNTGTQPVSFTMTGAAIPNWTQTLSPTSGTLAAGETRPVVFVLTAPVDVVDGARFSSILRVTEVANEQNFDVLPVHVNIQGGTGIPEIVVTTPTKTVDRAGVQTYEILVKNVGSKADDFRLTARAVDPTWQAYVQTPRGDNISNVTLQPQGLVTLNVTVRAPFVVPEHTIVRIEVTAETLSNQAAKVTLQGAIHDYGVHMELTPSRIDVIAGLATEFTIRLRNDGNDNDTLNVSAILTDTPDWTVQLATDRVRLEPGQSNDIRATVKSPTSPLPTPRAYTLKFYVGTLGGVAVNLSKNETIATVVNILNYRAVDVDRDDLLELAVDADQNPLNGFERFTEVFTEGLQTAVVANSRFNGRQAFFLDVPQDKPYDGIADVWFDPEAAYAYPIRHAIDLNSDSSPDYLLDTDRDIKIDRAYDTVSQTYWPAFEIKSLGDERIQYLIDTSGDGRPDRFYDPETKFVTRTQNVGGDQNLVGLDINNDGRIDKVYDIKANAVTDAKLRGFVDFARDYWYFFVVFAALVLVTVMLIVRRRRT